LSATLQALRLRAAAEDTGPALVSRTLTLSAEDALDAIERVTQQLVRHGVRALALAADNSPDWVIADLAAQQAGIPVVPIAPFFSAGQVAHVMRDSGVDAIAADEAGSVSLMSLPTRFAAELTPELTLLALAPAGRKEHLYPGTAKISYTSGTTGAPKGVCLTQESVDRVAASLCEATAGLGIERHLCLLPLATLLENVAGVYAPLMAGATVFLPSLAETGLLGSAGVDVGRLLACLAEYRPDSIILLPQLLEGIVTAVEAGAALAESLRFVAVGGGVVGLPLLERAERAGIPVYEGYGLTECGSVVALNTPAARRAGSVGRPLPHCRIRIGIDSDVFVDGPSMAGYVGDAAPHSGEVATGDIGYLDDDGYLFINGRRKNVFITSFGRNLSPEWVEASLSAQASVAQAALFGDGMPFNAAVIVPAPGSTIDAIERDVASVNGRLPDYARIRHWILAREPFSPASGTLTPNGRLRRREIQDCYSHELEACFAASLDNGGRVAEGASMSFSERLVHATQNERETLLQSPIIADCFKGQVSLDSYVAFLTEAYHHVRHTVPLLMACGSRLPERLDWLRTSIVEYIDEEHGHEQWILNDIEACGADRNAAARSRPGFATELMVSYAYDTIMRRNPVGFFGMVFVLEGTSVAIATQAAGIIERELGLPRKAFSYLLSHGSVDQKHIGDYERIVNRLDCNEDRAAVVHAARAFFRLYGDVFRQLPRAESGGTDDNIREVA